MSVRIRDRSTSLNLYAETSRLSPEQLTRWQGLPLCWVDARANASLGHHVQERPQISLLDAGEASADIDFGSRRVGLNLSAGAMGLFMPGEMRRSAWRCDHVRRIMIEIEPDVIAAQFDPDLACAARDLNEDLEFRDIAITGLMRTMAREILNGCPRGRIFAETASAELLTRLRDRLGPGIGHEALRGRLTPALRLRIDDYIEHHLSQDIPLAALAREAGRSVPHFARLFREATGLTPHRYVLGKRIERACELLRHTMMPLSGVAAEAGFSSQSHMNVAIKSARGCTPGQIRRAA